ncbi:DUF1885 family protein [Brevibacillus daliensis]|uniref:DUF1885 family protein n=1 Tax=Brevibacillus daliensis TaxID=2892995 RepID=UPI001E2FA0FE|nr:DUF1885 family protein [Brevibacillus daliensis]
MKLQSAYIYLVDGSAASTITLDELKELMSIFREKTNKTGAQLGWDYGNAAFPYQLEQPQDAADSYFLLKGNDPHLYKYLIMGVGKSTEQNQERSFIQVTVPDTATQNDKNKGNEFCRYLARELKGELHLFNGRVQYFQPRKP